MKRRPQSMLVEELHKEFRNIERLLARTTLDKAWRRKLERRAAALVVELAERQ